MMDKPKRLFDTARALLTSAAMRDDRLIQLPRLPMAAARQVIRSLLNAGLEEEAPAPIDDAGYAWCAPMAQSKQLQRLHATLLPPAPGGLSS
jgi:hypothetical protein